MTSSSIIDPAPLTDDSMSNSQLDEIAGDNSIIIENDDTVKSKPMPNESPKISDEKVYFKTLLFIEVNPVLADTLRDPTSWHYSHIL